MQAEQEVSSLQPRIDGLAFQRQDGENRLVDATQWLALDEALQRLMAEEEFADCDRFLPRLRRGARLPGLTFGPSRYRLGPATCAPAGY